MTNISGITSDTTLRDAFMVAAATPAQAEKWRTFHFIDGLGERPVRHLGYERRVCFVSRFLKIDSEGLADTLTRVMKAAKVSFRSSMPLWEAADLPDPAPQTVPNSQYVFR